MAAARLEAASSTGQPCVPIRDLIGPDDIDAAYAVQQRITRRRLAAGRTVIGHKIGLTSLSVQRQVGVDRPDFGVLFDDTLIPAGASIPSDRLLQPKAEAEVAFVLGKSLANGPLDTNQVRDAVHYASAALEIVDSRICAWDITVTDTIADNASSGMFVLGTRQVPIDDIEPNTVEMTLTKNGAVVSTGNGRECLGDPLNALAWLARTCRELGNPLQAGEIVLSGALGPMVDVEPECSIYAHISGLGTVSATFSDLRNFTKGDPHDT